MLYTVLLIILILMLVGALPMWPHAAGWNAGYYPSGLLLVLIIILIVLMLR